MRALLASACLAALATACAGAARPQPAAPSSAAPRAALSAGGRAALRDTAAAPRLPELAWADVRDAHDALRRFYDAGGWEPAWIRAGRPTPQARAVVRALKAAADEGLEARDYDGPDLEARLDALETSPPPTEAEQARVDVLVTVSALRYLSDLNGARARREGARGGGPPAAAETLDPATFLRAQVVDAADPDAALAEAEPPHPGYARTLGAYRRYRQLASASEDVPRLRAASGPLPGGAAGASLARWLWRLGDVRSEAEPRSGLPPAALGEAVARFQRRHGLAPTGHLDARTVKALDVPLARRAEQLALALERWRWMPRRTGAPPVVVSLPELRVRVPDAAPPLSLRAAAGPGCGRIAPTFAAELTRVVLRPASRAAPGAVEFVFPNPHAVTLSGAAAASPPGGAGAGAGAARECLRVERADELAAWVLRETAVPGAERSAVAGAAGWTSERVGAVLAGGPRAELALARPVPVLVVYATAVVGDDGDVRFLDDPAGADAALSAALAREAAKR